VQDAPLNAERQTPNGARTSAPLVGVVVVNWRTPDATRRCLDAVRQLTYPRCSPVLVDNGCADFSAASLADIPGAIYLRSETNLGFTGGSNAGMRAALDGGADWVWFLNSDARPEPAALDELVAVATRAPGAAIAGAKILRGDRPEVLDSAALQVDLQSGRLYLLGHGEVDRGQYDGLTDPVAVTACAMLVSRSACERFGGFATDYFAYMEDADLCLRAREAGWRVALAPRARVLHDRAPAGRGRQSLDSLYYSTRNHLLLLQRHCPGPPWQRKLQELRVIALSAAYAVRAGRPPWQALRAVQRGVADFRANVVGVGAFADRAARAVER
jgi:GT2 family glycosyltransferase